MKRSHDHTQLKRLAAISLVVVMCLSALPMLAPSASAAGEGETIPLYVWDGEGATELASEAANWYQDIGGVIVNDVLPTNNSHVLFDSTSVKSCTWDLAYPQFVAYSLTLATGYTGTLTQGDVDIGIGAGGIAVAEGATFTASSSKKVYCDGSAIFGPNAMTPDVLNIVLTGSGVFSAPSARILSFTLSGDYVAESRIFVTYENTTSFVDITGRLDLGGNALTLTHHYWNQNSRITGTIEGGDVLILQRSGSYEGGEIFSDSTARLIFRREANQRDPSTITLNSDMRWGGEVRVYSISSYDAPMTLDLNGHSLTANGLAVGMGGAIVGNGTIINHGDLDASAGSLSFTGKYVQAGPGTITLAPGQSFDRLEVASDDGRTASWTMTATGAQAPIVTGLESGVSYRWYLDGVEQGEVEAGEDGTIALSYMSTGLHSLEVKPTSMTEAMDGLYSALPLVISLAVLGGLFSMIGGVFGKLGKQFKR